ARDGGPVHVRRPTCSGLRIGGSSFAPPVASKAQGTGRSRCAQHAVAVNSHKDTRNAASSCERSSRKGPRRAEVPETSLDGHYLNVRHALRLRTPNCQKV